MANTQTAGNGAPQQRAPGKEIFGWAMFDFANSSYTTVIISVAFCTVFTNIIVGDGPDYRMGNLLWSIALSISYAIVVLTAPIFGAIMDFSATKKKFLFASYIITIAFTASLYFATPGMIVLSIILVIVSNFGFAVGESFVSSFLPDLGPPSELGKISGWAWGLGYFGGLASTILVSLLGDSANPADMENLRYIGPITGAFFLLAGIPTFLWLRERGTAKILPKGENYFSIGFKRLAQTAGEVKEFRDLAVFLIAFFFAYAGLAVVISFAFIYGAQVIKWDGTTKTMMFLITQVMAAGGALLFGYLQDKIGAVRTFNITLVIWIVAVILIYATNDLTAWLNATLGTDFRAQRVFLVVGSVAGLCLGSTQSSARALVGVFSPESKSGEFYGFWGLSGKLSSILGLFGVGILQAIFDLRTAILACSVLFFIAFVITFFVNEKRGMKAASEHQGE